MSRKRQVKEKLRALKQLKKELRQEEEKLKRVEMRKKKMKDQLDKAMVSSPNKRDVPKLKSESSSRRAVLVQKSRRSIKLLQNLLQRSRPLCMNFLRRRRSHRYMRFLLHFSLKSPSLSLSIFWW